MLTYALVPCSIEVYTQSHHIVSGYRVRLNNYSWFEINNVATHCVWNSNYILIQEGITECYYPF